MAILRAKKYSFKRRQKERLVENTIKQLKKVRWKYRNSIYLIVGLIAAYIIINNVNFDAFVSGFGDFGYVGAMLSGFLYAFSLTAVPSTAIFYKLGRTLSPAVISLFGALGCVVGDYLIFRFVKNELVEELKLITEELGSKVTVASQTLQNFRHISIFYRIFPFSNLLLSKNFRVTMFKISHSKTWRRMVATVAGLIIASPLPDEMGIALLGVMKFRTKYFVLFSFLLNFAGIFMISYFGGVA